MRRRYWRNLSPVVGAEPPHARAFRRRRKVDARNGTALRPPRVDPGKTVKERPVDVADGNIGRPRPKDNDTNDDDCPSR